MYIYRNYEKVAIITITQKYIQNIHNTKQCIRHTMNLNSSYEYKTEQYMRNTVKLNNKI